MMGGAPVQPAMIPQIVVLLPPPTYDGDMEPGVIFHFSQDVDVGVRELHINRGACARTGR